MNFSIKRENKLLRYLLKEAQTAIRIMFRDKSPLHLFDAGTAEGKKFVCLIAIAPEEKIMELVKAIDSSCTPDTIQESNPL